MISLSFWPFYPPHPPPIVEKVDFTDTTEGEGCFKKLKTGAGIFILRIYGDGGEGWGRVFSTNHPSLYGLILLMF